MRNPEKLFQALSDETRLKMLVLIQRHGELCVCDVMNVLEITQSKASRHLRYLANAGVLQDRRETVWAYYSLADQLDAAQKAVLDSVSGLLDKEELDKLEKKMSVWLSRKCCTTKDALQSGKSELSGALS